MTGVNSTAGILNSGTMSAGHSLTVIEDRRPAHRTTQADLATGRAVVALAGFGRNGDEGSAATYLLTGGPGGGALFTTVFGAVFSSIESFNAVTLFSDVTTGGTAQGKIVDFLAIGGTGAIGHAFEPYSDAIVDNEFFFYNLLADANGDGYADMSYGEAAFTALPYLSWSEVVLGDPLMRIAYGPGGIAKPYRLLGDTNFDRVVTLADLSYIASRIGARFGTSSLYCDAADINRDLNITYYDFWLASSNYGVSDK